MKYLILNTVLISTDQGKKTNWFKKGLQEEIESIRCFQIGFSLSFGISNSLCRRASEKPDYEET